MSKKVNTSSVVYDLVKPITDELNLILWDVRFEKEGASWFLRIIIDKKNGGVTFDDCESVSRKIDPILDEVDPIEQSYYLEVSSPGLCRELKKDFHFQQSINKNVLVKTIRPIDGKREFNGVLNSYNDGIICINQQDVSLTFKVSECSFIKLDDDIDFGGTNNE